KGAVTTVHSQKKDSFVSTLFLVQKTDGGQRPVISLKPPNNFVNTPHFKMEGIHSLKTLLRRGNWLVKMYLKDAYFSIPIHPEHQKFLSFTWGNTNYQFTCLQFGLMSAPWVFTKTMRPAAALGRELGMQMVCYIDDILVIAESK
uniref:Reverse transcriptase domain-containing protein n=1 Tax=Amphimedon queenslandica TaxID=400682 RepID=A0A1X7V7E5_AMPQE